LGLAALLLSYWPIYTLSEEPSPSNLSDVDPPDTTILIHYVDASATGLNNGTSWENAYTDLQDALERTGDSVQAIYVAEGTYKPTSDNSRTASFHMKNGLALLGGFPSGGGPRDWEAYPTRLSGDIGQPGDSTDNSYNVIQNGNLDNTAVLDGFIVEKGRGSDASGAFRKDGGGMLNIRSSPTIRNCRFLNNAAVNGGGIANRFESSPHISNCTFSANSAEEDGGAIVNMEEATATILNCIFSDNSAKNGGGLLIRGGALEVANTFFVRNSAEFGGGMFISQAEARIINSVFTKNTANIAGGLFDEGSDTKVVNSIFWENSSEIWGPGVQVTYSIVQQDSSVYPGPGNLNLDPLFVDPDNDDFHLQVCSPAQDAGTTEWTPSTDFEGDLRSIGPRVDIGADEVNTLCCPSSDTLYVDVSATGLNQGTSWENAYTDLQDALQSTCSGITTILVAKGTYKPTSGTDRSISFRMRDGITLLGGYPSGGGTRAPRINETILSGDIGEEIDYEGDYYNMADNSYHVIYNENLDSTAVIDGFSIQHGNADNPMETMSFGGGIYNYHSSPRIIDCKILRNEAENGGGVYNHHSSPYIVDCDIRFNKILSIVYGSRGGSGGGVYNYYSSPTISGGQIYVNVAEKGGGIYNDHSSPNILGTLFSGNKAVKKGAGIYNDSSMTNISKCTFKSNSAFYNIEEIKGAGIYNYFSSSTISKCAFYKNQAEEGGGIYNDNESSPMITFCSFDQNEATRGGGMYNLQSSPNISNCTFQVNLASENGGGIYNDKSGLKLTGVDFLNNEAENGGGIYNEGSSPNISDCTFMGNLASSNGGGIYIEDSSPNISDCTFMGNLASSNGGGLYSNTVNSSPKVYDCLFTENVALENGGAMFFVRAIVIISFCRISNNNFEGNKAFKGGAIYNQKNMAQIYNCSFSQNEAFIGGALYHEFDRNYKSLVLTNCSLSKNSAIGGGGAVYLLKPSITNFTNSIFWNNGTEIVGDSATVSYSIVQQDSGVYPGISNLNADPLFVDPENGDLHLQPCSPAIDAGTMEVINPIYPDPNIREDFEGDPRPVGAGVDMGVDEETIAWTIPPAGANSITANASCTDGSGWTHYYNTSSKVLLLSLKMQGTDALIPDDAVAVDARATGEAFWVDALSGNVVDNEDGAAFINRKWVVNPLIQPSNPVGVRFYYTTEEFDAVNTSILDNAQSPLTLTGQEQLRMVATTGADDFFDMATLPATSATVLESGQASTAAWSYHPFDTGQHYAEFYLDELFSGGAGGASGGAPFSSVTSTEDLDKTIGLLNIYPIPANDWVELTFSVPDAGSVDIRLVDMLGRNWQVRRQAVLPGIHRARLDLSSLEAGVYLVRIDNGATVVQARLVRQ
jgi:parallel beta-helix repeat protein